MKKNTIIFCFTILLVQTVNTANADITMSSYLKSRHKPYMQFYVVGVVRGLQWANTELISKGEQPLFCEPKSNILNNKDILPMIDALVDKVSKKTKERMDIENLIKFMLINTYPC